MEPAHSPITESPLADSHLPAPDSGWWQSFIIMAVSLLLIFTMFAASFVFPTLESGYLTVSLATLLLAGLALRRLSSTLSGELRGVLLFVILFAIKLSVICLFDGLDWSLLGEKRDGETGLVIGLAVSVFIALRLLRRVFPQADDRADMLLVLLFTVAAFTFAGMWTSTGEAISGMKAICACILTLLILPEVWRISQLSSGRRLALNVGAAYTVLNSLTGIYPAQLSGKVWVWLLWILACIAARQGAERQTPGIAIIERLILGVGIFLFALDSFGLLTGEAPNPVLVPACVLALLPLLYLLGRLNGGCPTLLCWVALFTANSCAILAAAVAARGPHSVEWLAKYLLPPLLLTIGIRHLWLRYRSGIRPLFINGKRAFQPLSMRSMLRTAFSACLMVILVPAFLAPGWMMVTNTSPTKLLAGLYGTPIWPGLPLFVTLVMHDEYYYYDKVPWRWPVPGDANAVIESLWHNPPDRFSFYTKVSLQEELDLYKPGNKNKLAPRLSFIERKDKSSGIWRILAIYPESPLEKAGIHRGDALLEVNHKPAKHGKICRELGEIISLTVLNPAGKERDVDVACAAAIPFKPFHRVIASASGPVGYLYLAGFSPNEYAGIEADIADLHKSGIRKLVLDLRYNGGGRAANERDLDARILDNRIEGLAINHIIHTRKYRDRDMTEILPKVSTPLGITQLVVLTTDETCSASEALINDLKPYLWVRTVGSKSCGKPMMMEVNIIGDMNNGSRLELVTAQIENAKGGGAYFKGIPPDCPVADDGNYDLGDPREKLLHEALHLLETGRCSK